MEMAVMNSASVTRTRSVTRSQGTASVNLATGAGSVTKVR